MCMRRIRNSTIHLKVHRKCPKNMAEKKYGDFFYSFSGAAATIGVVVAGGAGVAAAVLHHDLALENPGHDVHQFSIGGCS